MEWLSDNIVSIFAVIVAFIAGWYAKKQTDYQRRSVELEEQRAAKKKERENSAIIEAKIQYEDTGISKIPHKLIVENVGMKAAENVRIYVNEKPPSESDLIYVEGQKDVLPVLQPANPYYYVFGGEVNKVDSITVNILFDDPLAKEKECTTKLGL